MTGDFILSNCAICNCPNLNLHNPNSLHSSLNEERNLYKILCHSLDAHSVNVNKSSQSGSSLFCSECKVAIVTLNVIQEQIESLEQKKSKLISKLISSIIVSSSYQTQSIAIKQETEGHSSSNLNDNDKEEVQSLRQQICGRFCPIVRLKKSPLKKKLSLNHKLSEEGMNLNINDDEEDLISNNFENCLTDEEEVNQTEENTLDYSPANSNESESDSNSDSDWDPRSSSPLLSSSSSASRQGIKRKQEFSSNSTISKFKCKSNINEKKNKFGLFQPVVDDLGGGQFMYRDYFPFESVPGTCGFKCGSCHRIAKNIRSIRHHLHSHYRNSPHYEPSEKDKESLNRNGNDLVKTTSTNPRVGVRPLSTLELGPGKFITNGQWIFNEIQQPQQSLDFDEDGQPQQLQEAEADEEGQQQMENSICYQCETCHKILANKKRMVTHIREAHFLPNYVCDLCGREFSNKRNFENHSITHTDVKSFQCDICGSKYKQKAYLVLHLKSHANAFQCTFDGCDKSFRSRQGLVSHTEFKHSGLTPEENHSPCPHCGKLLHKKQLQKHIERVHEQVRNFYCSFCGKGFYEKRKWRDHVQKHEQEKSNVKVKSNNKNSKKPKKNTVVEPKEEVETEHNNEMNNQDANPDSLTFMTIGAYYKEIMEN